MTLQSASIFHTPVYVVDVPGAAALSDELRLAIKRQRASVEGVSKSNVGGWQSDLDMLAWGGGAARRLLNVVTGACDRMTLCRDKDARVRWNAEMWANVNRAGDSNQNHWHPGSYLSFVYYVDDGYEGSSSKSLGGELVFVDPRMPYLRMRTPHLRHRMSNGGSEEHETWVRPYSGLLIAFPSFMPHSVRPYAGAVERMSIAINLAAKIEH